MTSDKMRSRSNSGVRLDYYQRIIYKTILDRQNPVSGLLPTTKDSDHAWVRDDVYAILSVWSLSLAYRKNADFDEDRAKTYELEQSCVKMMRGLLMAMIRQRDKVERFKVTQSPQDSIHAKFSAESMLPVVGDHDWGHLQLDATSLFLLILAQMTASGLQIIFTLDEVAFIQNIVFYIESAYCTADYGIWERGDKTNHGFPELNASSVGLAKAALEATNELDLFGGHGGPMSVIHVLADDAQKCDAVLHSMLPRESNSKEVDAALLSVIGFPAFAIQNPETIENTRKTILAKLEGKYGCKRFLRDGYKTALEDPNRLHYEPSELKIFDKIECEWPLFFCYLIIEACFRNDRESAEFYSKLLDSLLVKTEDGLKLVPEMYAVPIDKVHSEYENPHSQERIPIGNTPFIWGQSLWCVGRMLLEGFIAPGELDPLNRRLGADKKPDVVVQVVILAEDLHIQQKLRLHDIHVQTVSEVSPVQVHPARVLSHLYSYLGRSKKLGLSGRKSKDVGLLSTSKLYRLQDKIFAFTPQFVDESRFYIASDPNLILDVFANELNFLEFNWSGMGRPIIIFPIHSPTFKENDRIPPAMLTTIKKLKSGYINGTRVNFGRLDDFLSTSCVTDLSFLGCIEDGDPETLNPSVKQFLDKEMRPRLEIPIRQPSAKRKISIRSRRPGIAGIVKRTRSIQVDPLDSTGKPSTSSNLGSQRNPDKLTAPQLTDEALDDIINTNLDSISLSSHGHDRSTSTNVIPSSVQTNHLTNHHRPVTSGRINDTSPTSPMGTDHDEDPLWTKDDNSDRHRAIMEQFGENITDEELMIMLKETDTLEEDADILQYLAYTRGLKWDTGLTSGDSLRKITVKDLLKDLYEKACHEKKWGLVRHTAGMLGKRVEDLAKSVTDLLVRQKQVTIGMPPNSEHTITRPLPSLELQTVINRAYGGDRSTAMLTQELLVYLGMFIRTEPNLFQEMLRLRVGLIIQVMACELSRCLKCSGEEASDHLLNLSPYEMKTLLHHIISGKEFAVKSGMSGRVSLAASLAPDRLNKKSVQEFAYSSSNIKSPSDPEGHQGDTERQGQWLRRRRLDGALNRVPKGFYPKVWSVLERCEGISIEGRILNQQLTREMTPGEMKFALHVEQWLNTVPQPEYRQLMVETLMVLALVVEYNVVKTLGKIVTVEALIHKANAIFLKDQSECDGDASLCCTNTLANPSDGKSAPCGGTAGICVNFYDSAPSGCFGTMTYLMRAVAQTLECMFDQDFECAVS